MSKEINRRKVTPVGNSWVICKSKSHPGHVYYFNSLTGQAAWNLSDAEIEKAKQTTTRLEQLPGAELACPEPKDKPPSSMSNVEPTQPALKKRIPPFTNSQMNTMPEQSSSLLANLNIPLNQMTSILQGTQLTNNSSLGPFCNMNLLNNPTPTINLNNGTPMFNPKVWAVPQAQQIFLPTPIAPIVNQGPNSLNGMYNNLVESTGLILDNLNNASSSSNYIGSHAFNARDLKYRKGFQQPINKKPGFTHKKDLRQMLSFKNKFQRKPGGPGAHLNSSKFGNHSNDFQNRIANKDNKCMDSQTLEESSKIDVTPLKNLAPVDCISDDWFIVMDLEVLLNEFKFLNTITDSAENPHGAEKLSMTEVIDATCTELLKKKYHFVLLTNDNELMTRTSLACNIHMFTISEVHNLLGIQQKKQPVLTTNVPKTVVPKQKLSVNELLNKIKITVPNNFPSNQDTSPDIDTQYVDTIEEDVKTKPRQDDITEEPVLSKQTVDTGIQTDFEDITSNSSVSKENEELNRVSNKIDIRKEVVIRPPETLVVVNVSDKKRAIKLKRSASNQPPVNSYEKRQCKWRRRHTTPQPNKQIPPHNNENINDKELEANTLSNDNLKEHEEPSNDDPVSESTDNRVINDSVESRESSIIAYPRNSVSQENVTIDETSTSGIISNTESSVDELNLTTSSNQALHSKTNDNSMYGVESTTMEQYLKVKCDEWISRFVQIMEEVLSQVLHQDPPFSNSKMPPPWTLHEAAVYNKDGGSEHDHEMIDDNDNIAEINNKSPVKRTLVQDESPKQVKFIRNININPSLFKHLNFPKSNVAKNSLTDKSNLQSEEKTNNSRVEEINTVETANETMEKENNAPTSQPSIVRKFTAFPELEKKLQISNNLYENHDEELDYDEDEEYLTEEYCSEEETNGELHSDPNSKTFEDVVSNMEETDSHVERDILQRIDDISSFNENNEKFKYAMYMFIQEIKDALSQVQILWCV
ncbi:hypothetical protein HF086_010316 [Spodoptera exigua]|uniref:Uncharacterized protein n=1 Tax=Spodoptera exigua TaxID=7107 RepID=A0A922M2N7_SPOEX|nr:hypothetical protein HF086_010316 [Spodoptera exigua]